MHRFAFAAALVSLVGCAKSSQVVLGLVTDIPVPTTLQAVQLEAYRNDVQVDMEFYDHIATQPGEPFALPGTFDYFSTRGGTPLVAFKLTGYGASLSTPLIERDAIVEYRSEDVLFMRMALVQACLHVTCSSGSTCIEGVCQTQSFDAARLPKYRSELGKTIQCDSGTTFIDTTTCGDSGQCTALPAGAQCLDGETCIEGTCYAAQ